MNCLLFIVAVRGGVSRKEKKEKRILINRGCEKYACIVPPFNTILFLWGVSVGSFFLFVAQYIADDVLQILQLNGVC